MNILSRVKKKMAFRYAVSTTKKNGIEFAKPNYIYKNRLTEKSVVVDVGCSHDPDLSIYFMDKYNVSAYGVDPTKKHFEGLANVENKYNKFKHVPYAVGWKNDTITFHESVNNISGSLMGNHKNIVANETIAYDVEVINIPTLLSKVNVDKVDFLKLDLEGAEFDLFENTKIEHFANVDQLYVEFHHHAIPEKTLKDTQVLVKKICDYGYKYFTLENANFLFYR
ncbi:FkbM family methyltransferase [Saprospiraceae bacterium]|nr:FkbM family methyltransferase [Saprospiraceae bacterium]